MNKQMKWSFLMGLAVMGLAAADFVNSQIIFSFDAQTSFMVFTLANSGTNFTNSMTTSPGNSTEAYFFNSTNPTAALLVPCSNADSTSCQAGMGRPAYRYRSTGNINTSVWLKLDSDPTGITIGANSSENTACSTGVLLPYASGNLNSSKWALAGTQVGINSPCYDLNITMYATFSTPPAGTQIKTLTINSTASP